MMYTFNCVNIIQATFKSLYTIVYHLTCFRNNRLSTHFLRVCIFSYMYCKCCTCMNFMNSVSSLVHSVLYLHFPIHCLSPSYLQTFYHYNKRKSTRRLARGIYFSAGEYAFYSKFNSYRKPFLKSSINIRENISCLL